MRITKSVILVGVLATTVVLFGATFSLSNIHPFRWHRLTVHVSSGDRPRPDALVQIRLSGLGIPIAISRTNGKGKASFWLPEGRYVVRAEYRAFALQLSPAFGEQVVDLRSDMTVDIAVRGGM